MRKKQRPSTNQRSAEPVDICEFNTGTGLTQNCPQCGKVLCSGLIITIVRFRGELYTMPAKEPVVCCGTPYTVIASFESTEDWRSSAREYHQRPWGLMELPLHIAQQVEIDPTAPWRRRPN